MEIKIIGCAICQDRSWELIPNVKQVYPYVDNMVLVNGGDTEGWVDKVKNLDTENKIKIVDFPWCDNFPLSRNQYLINAGEFKEDGKSLWIMRFDSDEFISVPFLERAKQLINWAENHKYTSLGIRAYDVTLDKEGKETSASLSDSWWKHLVYKWHPNLRYIGVNGNPVHEGYNMNFRGFNVPSKEDRGIENALVYRHVKKQGDVWARAQRNFFIDGGGPNYGEEQPLWKPFRQMLDDLMPEPPKTYHDYINYLERGKIDVAIRCWFIIHMYEGEKVKPKKWVKYAYDERLLVDKSKEFTSSDAEKKFGFGYNGASEVKEGYKLYFRWLHPEEEPEELKGLHIP